MPDVGISVVSWNVRDLLEECLRSARRAIAAAGLEGRLWVVDNASHDGSADLVAGQFPDARLIASPSNLGFAGGQNLAMRAMGFADVPVPDGADGLAGEPEELPPRYVLILNPDTVVDECAIAEMVRWMDAHPDVGTSGPRLVYGDGRFQHAAYQFPTLAQTFLEFWPINWRLTESRLNGRYSQRLYTAGHPFPIDHPLGAAMLFRQEAIAQTRGFDLEYHMYVEEIDWCTRVKRAGWGIYCVPSALVVHYEGQSTRQVRPQMVVALWRSRYLFFRKHRSPLYRRAVREIIRAGMRKQIGDTRLQRERGEIDADAAQALIDAYSQVMAMR